MALPLIKGKVWKFADNISTDNIMPGFARGATPEERASYCMRAIRPGFAGEVKRGDVIIAGKNFGCGSSRAAAANLITLGVGCVIARSFGRIFFRNSVNLGFPVLYCREAYDAFDEGDIVQVNISKGEIKGEGVARVLRAEPLPEIALKILEAGGIVAMLRKEYAQKK